LSPLDEELFPLAEDLPDPSDVRLPVDVAALLPGLELLFTEVLLTALPDVFAGRLLLTEEELLPLPELVDPRPADDGLLVLTLAGWRDVPLTCVEGLLTLASVDLGLEALPVDSRFTEVAGLLPLTPVAVEGLPVLVEVEGLPVLVAVEGLPVLVAVEGLPPLELVAGLPPLVLVAGREPGCPGWELPFGRPDVPGWFPPVEL
jgi:hypothetical protein